MSQEEKSPRVGAPSPPHAADAGQRLEATADARDPWRYVEAVYPLNRGLPHAVDFPQTLT